MQAKGKRWPGDLLFMLHCRKDFLSQNMCFSCQLPSQGGFGGVSLIVHCLLMSISYLPPGEPYESKLETQKVMNF